MWENLPNKKKWWDLHAQNLKLRPALKQPKFSCSASLNHKEPAANIKR